MCLPGNPSPCNRVSRDTAWDALTSAPKAGAKPARWHRAEQSRPARGRSWGPAGRIAPPLAGKGSQKQAGEAGVGDTDPLHVNAAPLPPTNTRGPAPLASPGCPRRKGGRTGSSLGGSEQIPRKIERGPEEVRSTPQPKRGPRPLRGGGKAVHLGSHFCQNPHFHPVLPYHFSSPIPHLPEYQQPPGALHNSENPYFTFLTFRPLGPLCGSQWAPFLLWRYFAIRTLGMKPKLHKFSVLGFSAYPFLLESTPRSSTTIAILLPTTALDPLQAWCLPSLGSFLSPASAGTQLFSLLKNPFFLSPQSPKAFFLMPYLAPAWLFLFHPGSQYLSQSNFPFAT